MHLTTQTIRPWLRREGWSYEAGSNPLHDFIGNRAFTCEACQERFTEADDGDLDGYGAWVCEGCLGHGFNGRADGTWYAINGSVVG